MDAIISGTDSVAICIDGDQFCLIRLDDDKISTSPLQSISYQIWLRQLSASAIRVTGQTEAQIINTLKLEWAKDRSVRMAFIAADESEDDDLRKEARECLAELFLDERVKQWFVNKGRAV